MTCQDHMCPGLRQSLADGKANACCAASDQANLQEVEAAPHGGYDGNCISVCWILAFRPTTQQGSAVSNYIMSSDCQVTAAALSQAPLHQGARHSASVTEGKHERTASQNTAAAVHTTLASACHTFSPFHCNGLHGMPWVSASLA